MAVHGAPEDRTEVILLIYARYPINGLNGEMSSKNIRKLCHSIYAAIRNSYKTPSAFSIAKRVIKSQEGTIQGDPIAMLLYGVATLPLIDIIEDHDFTHKLYADEGNVAGSLELLRIVLDKLYEHGSPFVYIAVHGAPGDRTEVILLIYARYPINSLNREMSFKNIRKLCHSIYAALRNSYKTPSAFSIDKRVIKSQEGTTQGDPLAMLLYGVATLPLIAILEDHDFLHKWYADESNVAGSLELLRIVLDKLYELGGPFVYMAVHGAPEDRTEVILLMIYARYPFNSLNREMSLKNIRKLCHSIYAAIRNSYKTPSAFSIDKRVIKSQEGTT